MTEVPAWVIEPFDHYDKSLVIRGPEFLMYVDHDDVPPVYTEKLAEWVVEVLNRGWFTYMEDEAWVAEREAYPDDEG